MEKANQRGVFLQRGLNVAQIFSVIVSGVFSLVKCSLFLGMWVISVFCPFPLSFSLHTTFPCRPPVVKGRAGKMRPNRGEKWNIDFFLFFLSSLNSWWLFQLPPSPLFFSPPCLEWSVITTHNSLHIGCAAPWWGLRKSWSFIKLNKVCEMEKVSVCVCFPFRTLLRMTCTWWPRTHKILPTPLMYWRYSSETVGALVVTCWFPLSSCICF